MIVDVGVFEACPTFALLKKIRLPPFSWLTSAEGPSDGAAAAALIGAY